MHIILIIIQLFPYFIEKIWRTCECVCVCDCVRGRGRETETQRETDKIKKEGEL